MYITAVRMPVAYRIIFVLLDIAMPIMGVGLNTISPLINLTNYTPKPIDPPSLETYVLLDATSGFFAMLAFLNVYFWVYRPNDVLAWKGLVGAVLLQDLFMIGGFLRELRLRGGAEWLNGGVQWRGQDYGNVIGYVVITLLRVMFVAGIGLGKGKTQEEEEEEEEKKRA